MMKFAHWGGGSTDGRVGEVMRSRPASDTKQWVLTKRGPHLLDPFSGPPSGPPSGTPSGPPV